MTVTVASGSKNFPVGAAPPELVHVCARMALSDAKDQSGNMGLYLWAKSTQDFYTMSIVNDKFSVYHRLYGKVFELVPPTGFAAAKKGDDQLLEIDVKANDTGADVEIDGQHVARVIARPSTDAKGYGVIFAVPPGKPSSFRLGPVSIFGDGH